MTSSQARLTPALPDAAELPGLVTRFSVWLTDEALPFQLSHARDEAGFHERIEPDGTPLALPRRARVAARQLYAFSRLVALGIAPETGLALGRHARSYLLAEHLGPEGAVIPVAGEPERFDLYDTAFALFALAAADMRILPAGEAHALASAIRQRLEAGWRNCIAGFEEAMPRRLPLRSNPHMHTLEACLEWERTRPEDENFARIADEIAGLCISRFRAPGTGALCEIFDGEWCPLSGPGSSIEPGHQYEWGWLLLRWGRLRGRADAVRAGIELIDLAEGHGINADGLAGSLLHADLTPADMTARLWPQTERIKAWALRARMAGSREEARHAEAIAAEACAGLLRFFEHPLPGSWWENLGPGGRPIAEPARTSSLYHIVAAYSELRLLAP
ncbi:AGE family epimerase/isomerase [Pseudoroseicyclus sp. CXY001]|uniref:AGE family epimerase/isomerase n=1 Tax=Pseudoroseicyclus sp. CXY001 TaxID=3242492 RepID=UPI003570D633